MEDLKVKGYTTEEISVIAKNINETTEIIYEGTLRRTADSLDKDEI